MSKHHLYYFAGLALLPLVIAGLFVLIVSVQVPFRYDTTYFTPRYQELYYAPSSVAAAFEQVLQTGDLALFEELAGLRKKLRTPEPNPNMVLTVLLKVDDRGYFQFLYYDVKTYERATHYVKEVKDRWVLVPQDAYFYLDSGQWLIVFTPVATIWWVILIVVGATILVFRTAARIREALFQL